jgi:hypothetical protein
MLIKESSYLTLIITQTVVILILLVYLVFSIGDGYKITMLEQQVERMEDFTSACIMRNDSLSVLLQEIRISNSVPPFLDKRQIGFLREKGLSEPVNQLRDDLISRPELISRPGVHGGTAGFYFRDGIHILNTSWVFAYFEDGHVDGALLLRYSVGRNGSISWEVLDEISR